MIGSAFKVVTEREKEAGREEAFICINKSIAKKTKRLWKDNGRKEKVKGEKRIDIRVEKPSRVRDHKDANIRNDEYQRKERNEKQL